MAGFFLLTSQYGYGTVCLPQPNKGGTTVEDHQKTNITLIGMFLAGKSTVGRRVANMLGWNFVDLDRVIEARHDETLSKLLELLGPEQFLLLEQRSAFGLSCEKTVIAPGGSIVYCPRAMGYLRSMSTIVHLSVPEEVIAGRFAASGKRDVVMESGQTIRSLYHERLPLYQGYADHTVAYLRESCDMVAQKVIDVCNGSIPRQ